MICRKCKKVSKPMEFGYCRECARKMGAVFTDWDKLSDEALTKISGRGKWGK